MTQEEDARSQAAVQQGGLPLRAQARMAELGRGQQGFFTSTLSAAEGVIAKHAGLEVVSQVMGSSTYHVGFTSYLSSWNGGELLPLTLAHERARLLALSRMEQEAMLLRAHAVIDTRFMARLPRMGDRSHRIYGLWHCCQISRCAEPTAGAARAHAPSRRRIFEAPQSRIRAARNRDGQLLLVQPTRGLRRRWQSVFEVSSQPTRLPHSTPEIWQSSDFARQPLHFPALRACSAST